MVAELNACRNSRSMRVLHAPVCGRNGKSITDTVSIVFCKSHEMKQRSGWEANQVREDL